LLKTLTIPRGIRRRWIEFVVRPRLWQSFAIALPAAAAVYAVEIFFVSVTLYQGSYYVVWPINGLALGALRAARPRHWPWMLAAFATGVAASEIHQPHASIIVDTLCNVLEVLLPALALPRFRTMDKWLSQPGLTRRFILLAVVAAPGVDALLAPLYLSPTTAQSYWQTAIRWGAADMIGIALFTPLLLALLSPETWRLFRRKALPGTIGLISLLTAATWAIFHQDRLQIVFVLYPMLLLVGTELGLSGAILAVNLQAVIATQATVQGIGPFGRMAAIGPGLRILELQLFLALSMAMLLPVGVARVRRLTTEAKLKRAWQAMEGLATLDGLTGIANRRRFDTALEEEWRRAGRARRSLSLLLIDVDQFKAYNDNYGHLAGDASLRAIAQAISQVAGRPGDLIARYGGEEFAVLLPAADADGAARVAARVCGAVHDLALPHLFSMAQRVTVSIGVATVVPEEGIDPLVLIAIADKALYNAKHRGRNQVCTADHPVAVPY
jgi:diguanylate cyclase (GGDEF)-like protein